MREEFGDAVDLILDGVPVRSASNPPLWICRLARRFYCVPGGSVSRRSNRLPRDTVLRATSASPRASGTLAAHYAPKIPLVLVSSSNLERAVRDADGSMAVLAHRANPGGIARSLVAESRLPMRELRVTTCMPSLRSFEAPAVH